MYLDSVMLIFPHKYYRALFMNLKVLNDTAIAKFIWKVVCYTCKHFLNVKKQ